MSNTRTRLRRAISGGAAAVTVGATVLAFAPVASATSDATATRIAGADRYATAADAAQAAYPTTDTAILADGEPGHFPDALAGNYLAGQINAPILLTRLASTPAVTMNALKAMGVKNLYLLGGTGAISQAQEDALTAAGFTIVKRLGGADRWGTDQAVDEGTSNAVGTFNGKKTALVAYGLDFPDALAAGSLSFAQHFPIVITKAAHLTPEAKATLSDLGIQQVIISGGTSVVQNTVVDDLTAMGISVLFRANGINRADTSAQLAQWEFDNIAGWDKTGIGVASGYASGDGADALAGGVWTGKKNESMLVTFSNVSAGQQLLDWVTKNSATIKNITIFGGTGAVSTAVENAIVKAAQTQTSNQTYTVSPSTQQNVSTTNSAQNVQYSVSGIPASTGVTVELFNCGNVSTNSGGQTVFTGTNPGGTGNAAQQGDTDRATITVVNGTPIGSPANTESATSSSTGTVTFTVNVPQSDVTCVVPVVYQDKNGNGALDLNANGTPSEPFGTGGAVNAFEAAPAPSSPSGTVSNPTSTTFDEGGFTYTYSSSDVYQLVVNGACTADSFADFQQRLSSGDSVTGYYNAPNQSTFCLNDTAPAAPATVTAVPNGTGQTAGTNAGTGGVSLTFPDSTTSAVTSYTIYRAQAAAPTITGGSYTCPTYSPPASGASPQTPPSSPYTSIASVPDTNATSYTYNDTSVAPAAGTTTTDQYCYVVSSVEPNAAGGSQTGSGTNASGGVVPAPKASATTAPKFVSATATGASPTATVTYNQAVLCSTVDTDGSDYTAYETDSTTGISTALPVTAASCTGTSATTVTLTLKTAPTSGQTVVFTAQNGTDKNTVGNTATPAQYQPVGDAVQTTAA